MFDSGQVRRKVDPALQGWWVLGQQQGAAAGNSDAYLNHPHPSLPLAVVGGPFRQGLWVGGVGTGCGKEVWARGRRRGGK